MGLVTAYAYRTDLEAVVMRVAGELMPPGQAVVVEETSRGEHAVRLRKQPNGHFAVRANVNGAAMSLLVDTGASTVVLRTRDAERIGIDTSRLSFSTPVSTANGTTYAAPVRLKSISVGPHRNARCGGAHCKARRAKREPARYDFLKAFAVV